MSHRLNRSGIQCFVPKNRVIYYHFGAAGAGESKSIALADTKAYLELNDQRKLIACEKGINQWLGKIGFSWTSDL